MKIFFFFLYLICVFSSFAEGVRALDDSAQQAGEQNKRCKLPTYSYNAQTHQQGCRADAPMSERSEKCCGGFECVHGECKHVLEKNEGETRNANANFYASSFAVVSQLLAQDAVHLSQVLKDKVDETAQALQEAEQQLQDLSEAAKEDIQKHKQQMHEKIDKLTEREGKIKEEIRDSMDTLNKLKAQTHKLYMETLGQTSSERVVDSTNSVGNRIEMALTKHQPNNGRRTSEADEVAELKRRIKVLELKKKLKKLQGEDNENSVENKLHEDDNYLNDEEGSFEHKQITSDSSNSNVGAEGGPCGKTNYKDFGPCKDKGMTCVPSDVEVAEGWVPGRCKRLKKNNEKANTVSFAKDQDYWSPGMYMPCGKTSFYDFGSCNSNLTCKAQDGMPKGMGLCVRKRQQEEDGNSAQEVVSHYAGYGGWSPGMYMPCGKTSFYDFGPCKSNFTCASQTGMPAGMGLCVSRTPKEEGHHIPKRTDSPKDSEELAETASELAEEIADSSERLAEKLLAAAAHLRRAAVKLKAKAGTHTSGWNQVANIENTIQEHKGFPYAIALMSLVGVALVALWIWRRYSSGSSYERI